LDKIQRIKTLVKELNIHRNNYYNLNKPTITDLQYDKMVEELYFLEQETGYILSNSPTITVGYEVKSKLQKRTHPTLLKSLDKTKSIDELNEWRKGKDILLMLKNDGLTVEVNYENGEFTGGYTRGNGEIGEEISHNIKVINDFPLFVPFKGKLRLSGEAIIHKDDFEEINSKLPDDEKYATPRNLVSGSVRQLNSEICSQRKVYFHAFNIIECNKELSDSKFEQFQWLKDLGFTLVEHIKISTDITEDIIDSFKDLAEEKKIPIDGLVVSYNSAKYSNSLSETSHHPLHSLSFKFYDDVFESTLRDVEWNTTRTGLINPTAIFDTVIIDNTEVSRASLHNLSFIEGLNLNIGCKILVSKRNLIIPHVEDNLDRDNGNMLYPEHCPSCGEETYVKNTGTADVLFCKNKNCQAQLLDKMVNFVKRNAMNIEGLSEATLEKFLNLGFIKIFGDIYRLEQYKSKIIKLEGFGIKSYNKLLTSIENSKNVKLANFIVGLGIEGVGSSTAKLIAKKFKTIHDFINAKNVELLNIDGIGDITAESIVQYRLENVDIILDLVEYMNFTKEEIKVESSLKSLEGLTFVVTGSVETFKNRKELEELITSLLGKLSGSVSAKTNFLINNDITSTSGKNKKANELGVKIISESMFNEMIGRVV